MAHVIGETRPCFGEYKCPNCKRIWESSKAWRHYGQKCKHCCINVHACKLQELFHYVCESCFKQTQGFEGHWTYKLLQQGKACRTCGKNVRPCLTYSDFVRARKLWSTEEGGSQGSHIDPNLSHLQDLCEKCTRLGYSCTKTLASGNVGAYIRTENIEIIESPKVRLELGETIPKTFSFKVVNERVEDTNNFFNPPKKGFITNGSSTTNGLSYREVAARAIAAEDSNSSGNGRLNVATIQKSDMLTWPVTYCSVAATGIKSGDAVMIDAAAIKGSTKIVPSLPGTDVKCGDIDTGGHSGLNCGTKASMNSIHIGNSKMEFPPLAVIDTNLSNGVYLRKRLKSPENCTKVEGGSGTKMTTKVKGRQEEMGYFDNSKINRSICNNARSGDTGHYEDSNGSRPDESRSNSRGMIVFIGVGVAAAAAFFLYRNWGK